jgi:2-amino-4-hydroxy-6-hydroxymethyldihydropteridine diphosphokinase
MKIEVCLSLGSNLGDRAANLAAARKSISSLPGVTETAASSLYETEPVGMDPSYAEMLFINAALVIEAGADVAGLAAKLRAIEAGMGRQSAPGPNLPRRIDIDVICAGSFAIETPALTVPHPRWQSRRFVVEPLAEIRPRLVIPGADRTVLEILRRMPERPAVRRFAAAW